VALTIDFFVTALKEFAKTLAFIIERRDKGKRQYITDALTSAEDFTLRLYTK